MIYCLILRSLHYYILGECTSEAGDCGPQKPVCQQFRGGKFVPCPIPEFTNVCTSVYWADLAEVSRLVGSAATLELEHPKRPYDCEQNATFWYLNLN